MLKNWLKKMYRRVGKNSPFDCDFELQKKYLYKQKEPKNNIERSFFQYKAQMKLCGWWRKVLVNIGAIPFLVFYYFKKSSKKIIVNKADAVFVRDGLPCNVMQESLRKEFFVIEVDAIEGNKLTSRDRRYIFKLSLKHPFSWLFLLKTIIKIMRYRWIIDTYNPKALIVCNEYSFTSSLLTEFCNQNDVELINVMHGEKLFFIRDSFFKFNRCYIWSEFYKELFTELRADSNQFIVEIPPSLKFASVEAEKTVDYTYYLQMQKGEELAKIVETLSAISKRGDRVAVRPHPRYTNLDELKALINDVHIEIESCKEITIENSILRTKNVISLYSTVLLQAYINGVNIVIDDISNKDDYLKLVNLKYVMLNAEHKLLSNIE